MVVALSAVVLAVIAIFSGIKAEDSRLEAVAAQNQATEDLWLSLKSRARAERLSGDPGKRSRSLQAIEESVTIKKDMELRNEALGALQLFDISAENFHHDMDEGASGWAFGEELDRFAVSRFDGTTTCFRVQGSHTVKVAEFKSSQYISFLVYDPSGRYLAGRASYGNAYLWDLEKGERIFKVPARISGSSWRSIAFDPRDKVIAFSNEAGRTVVAYDLDTLERKFEIRCPSTPGHLWYHPVRDAIGVKLNGAVGLFEAKDTGQLIEKTQFPSTITNFSWSPDGAMLAAGSETGEVYNRFRERA